MQFFTIPNMMFTVGMISLLFTVYHYFRNPQIKSERNEEVMDLKLKWSLEASDKRFTEVQENIKEAFNLASNHTHSVESKVDLLRETVTSMSESMGKELVRLGTIIEERFPRK